MIRILAVLLIAVCLAGCKNKKVSLNSDEPVDIESFIEFFPEMKLPVQLADTSVDRKLSDSLLISRKIFDSFIPDSVLTGLLGKKAKPLLYAFGRTREKEGDYYLFIKAVNAGRIYIYLVCFDARRQYAGALPVIRPLPGYAFQTLTLDSKFQITLYREKRMGVPESGYKRDVYIHSSDPAGFTLILTEPNEEIIEKVINPIDTLPRKNKWSGDYVRDKKNLVSVRDGRNASEIQFFVHFEQDRGACTGGLKGRARLIRNGVALYQEPGNPCALQFTFTSTASAVSLQEKGGCGSYRGITCFFEGRFPRKKEPRRKTPARSRK